MIVIVFCNVGEMGKWGNVQCIDIVMMIVMMVVIVCFDDDNAMCVQ